jgi:repressor LexA
MRLFGLKEIRQAAGKTQKQVAEESATPIDTYRGWEQLKSSPRSNELIMLADYFGCTVDELMGRIELPKDAIKAAVAKGVWIPVYGSIAAGTPMEMVVNEHQAEAPDTIVRKHPKVFYLVVKGDSMDKEVLDKSLVMIDPESEVRNGDTVAVNINGYDAALKVFFETSNTIIFSPNSHNSEHKDIIIDKSDPSAEDIRIIGKKIWALYPHPDMISYFIN